MDDEDLAKKQSSPLDALEAEKLDSLSGDELRQRIKILKREIERAEADLKTKEASMTAAESVFKT
ncbi:MAG: DUF1192 domain-containing protein [Proteobacteria bacterium]|nr:DUF1192 domain-containing protein [Pseudomonadota bacterium]